MASRDSIYLDNAATSGRRPDSVYGAIDEQMRYVGGAAGRGQHTATLRANQIAANCRAALAMLIQAPTAESIALTSGCTMAINMAFHGLIPDGAHVVTTAAEHNSVLRPLEYLRQKRNIQLTVVPCDVRGGVDPQAIEQALRPNTYLVAITAASNVTGATNDLRAVAQILEGRETIFFCDAAQALGYLPLDVQASRIDVLAMPGHKGLMGPLGTGALYVHARLHSRIEPMLQGGTGTSSDRLEMPAQFPQKMEAGNMNIPGFAGMLAGARYLAREGLQQNRLRQLTERLLNGLREIPGITVHGPASAEQRVGVVSVSLAGWAPHEAAATLDASFGIQTRAGLHCASLIHHYLGTSPNGTLRISLGHFTQADEVVALLVALSEMVGAS